MLPRLNFRASSMRRRRRPPRSQTKYRRDLESRRLGIFRQLKPHPGQAEANVLYTPIPPEASSATGPIEPGADFDPARFPILAIHFFGVELPCSVGPIAAEVVADLQRRHHAQQVHRLGAEHAVIAVDAA